MNRKRGGGGSCLDYPLSRVIVFLAASMFYDAADNGPALALAARTSFDDAIDPLPTVTVCSATVRRSSEAAVKRRKALLSCTAYALSHGPTSHYR